MKRHICFKAYILLVIILFLATGCENFGLSVDNAIDGWAVLAEKDDYSGLNMDDLLVDYIDITRMRQALENSGWNLDHIHELREFNRETLQTELDWLEENADENDIVILYVSGHGGYLIDVLKWRAFFSDEWKQISSQRRLLVVDTCQATNITNAVASDPSPHLSIAAVDGNEYGWKGLEEEGLPIIGGVFTYYFTAALDDPNTDANNDGMVSVQEAALKAEEQQRTYFHEVVLVVPEFVTMFHVLTVAPERDPTYPHVIVDDAIGEPLFLTIDTYP